MFNEAWIALAVMMLVIGGLAQQPALLVVGCLLLTVAAVAWLWQLASFYGLSYERRLDQTRVFEGEQVRLTLRLSNRKWLPLAWVQVVDQFPLAIPPAEKQLAPSAAPLVGVLEQRASLLGHERARWDYTIPCRRRGYYGIGPAIMRTGDLFGLFERARELEQKARLIVYPRIDPLEEWGLPPKEPFGDARTRLPMFQEPTRIRGLRDYRPDDAPKHIHWRASAHRAALQVKLYDPTVNYELVIFLNLATYERAWEGIESARAERAIRLAASLANYAAEHKYALGLVANGTWPDSDQRLRVLPGRSPDQLRRVLEALAAVSYFVTTPIDELLRTETSRLPWGATLVVVTPLVTENLLAQMLRLQEAGRKLALISLDERWEPRELPGILVRQARAPAGA